MWSSLDTVYIKLLRVVYRVMCGSIHYETNISTKSIYSWPSMCLVCVKTFKSPAIINGFLEIIGTKPKTFLKYTEKLTNCRHAYISEKDTPINWHYNQKWFYLVPCGAHKYIIKATPTIVGEAFIFYLWSFFLQRTDTAARRRSGAPSKVYQWLGPRCRQKVTRKNFANRPPP